ncbi:MAG TPA: aminopeptidase N [Pedococcus sp.]|jgi:aminopeptidase N|nr:aminopeptidase N [Pedococcus sp.]
MASLLRTEAERRAGLLRVHRVEVDLELDRGPETFGSRTRVTFGCTEPGASTFLDVRPVELRSVTLNGEPLDLGTLDDGRLPLPGLGADNVVEVDAVMAYSRDGQGLHRAVDPADGEHYVYGHLFLDAAPRVFACFDQPDLKASYAVSVTVPPGWQVVGNGAAREVEPGRWELAETRPLATYFVTVCAGPWASVRAEHDGIPLGLHARASLGGELERQAPQMLEVTRAGFDYYHSLFGIRYPFGEYHQVFVPEFNAGAMENPGCVTFRDQLLFRGAAARDQVLERTNTIVHEMAHMWFGDLVTMRWWDDLWLNESFAEYMSHRTSAAATEFTDAWVDATMARKAWGYAAERAPSTHPVAGADAPDARSALQNFDGISYAKGSAVLRQLIAHVGDDAFIEGVSAYLRAHEFGNGTLADFLGAIEQASGTGLDAWSAAWLTTAGVDVISVDAAAGVVNRTAPQGFPADRQHTTDVAGFSAGAEAFRLPLTIDADRTVLPGLAGAPPADVVVPNAADLTWASVDLDAQTLANLPSALGSVPDAQARAVVWVALMGGVCLGNVDPRLMVGVFGEAWPQEDNDSILNRSAAMVLGRVVAEFLPHAEQLDAEAVVAEAAGLLLEASAPASTRALIAARTLAASSADDDLLQAWAAGADLPAGLEHDSDFHWLVVRRLAARGVGGAELIETALAADDTMQGRVNALTAKASVPSSEAKAWAWDQLTRARDRSNHELNALAQGFWLAPEPDLVRPYVPRYFTDVPAMRDWLGEDALERVARLAYPARMVEAATAELGSRALDRSDLSPAVRRTIVDADSRLQEALRSREVFG